MKAIEDKCAESYRGWRELEDLDSLAPRELYEIGYIHGVQDAEAEANTKSQELQARIDALMLEYCPNEMTPEQTAEWQRHQRPCGTTMFPEDKCDNCT